MKLSPRLGAFLTKSHRNLKASISSYSNSTATLACPCKLRDLFVSLMDHVSAITEYIRAYLPSFPSDVPNLYTMGYFRSSRDSGFLRTSRADLRFSGTIISIFRRRLRPPCILVFGRIRHLRLCQHATRASVLWTTVLMVRCIPTSQGNTVYASILDDMRIDIMNAIKPNPTKTCADAKDLYLVLAVGFSVWCAEDCGHGTSQPRLVQLNVYQLDDY